MSEPRSVGALIDLGVRVLRDSSHIFEDHDHQREVEDLMAHALRVEVDDLDDDHEPPARMRERYLSLVARRAGGEPFPLLVGSIDFYGLKLPVRPGSFVPRPSSELMVECAVRRLSRRKNPVVVDVCTGGGPIALAIADEITDAVVWGTDIDDGGLAQGRRNASKLGIRNVNFRKGDMYGSLPRRLLGAVDVITGHIPYVPPDEIDDLPAEVRDHEPIFTLSDLSADGLGLLRRAVVEAPKWLKGGGWVLLEVSEDLEGKVNRICRKAGFARLQTASDDDGLSIVVQAQMPR